MKIVIAIAAVVCALLAVVHGQPLRLTTPEGNDCHFGGANGPFIVSTCKNASGIAVIYQFRCDTSTSPPDCAVVAIIPPPTDMRTWNKPLNTTGIQTAISVTGTANYTAIVARVVEPMTRYETFVVYYCDYAYSDNLHNATCARASIPGVGMVWRNPVGQVALTSVDGAEIMAVVTGKADINDDDAIDAKVSLYRCVGQAAPGAYLQCLAFQTVNFRNSPAAINLTVAATGYRLAIGNPDANNGRGKVMTYDCSDLSDWWGPSSATCWFIEELTAAEQVPQSRFGEGIVIAQVGNTNQAGMTVFSSMYRQLDAFTGGFTSFLWSDLALGGSSLRVAFTPLPFAADNAAPSNQTGVGTRYGSSSIAVTGTTDSTIYVGKPFAHRGVGEIDTFDCVSGVLCTRNRAVLFFEDGPTSDLLGARIVVTPQLTVAGSGDDRVANGGTYILESRSIGSLSRRKGHSANAFPMAAVGASRSAVREPANVGILVVLQEP